MPQQTQPQTINLSDIDSTNMGATPQTSSQPSTSAPMAFIPGQPQTINLSDIDTPHSTGATATGPTDVQTVSAAMGDNPLKTGVNKGIGETAHTLGAAAAHLMPNSWRDAIGLPSSFKEPDYLQSTNGAETAGKVGESIAEFVMGDEALKGLQITERLGLAQKMASMAKSSPYIAKILEHGLNAVRGGAVATGQQLAHGATPTEALKTGAEATALGAGTGAAIEGASALADSPVGQAVKTGLGKVKGLPEEIWKGEKVAQPGATIAVRGGVQAGADAAGTADETLTANIKNQPLVKGHATFMDDHIDALDQQEKAAYKKMDDTAGFDVKALKDKLSTDQYNLKQLGSSDPDKTGRLVEAINESTDRIAEAETKMKAAGIDPTTADALHKQGMAGEDFKKSLVKNTNPADQSVNVDGLLNDAKKLRFNKYGDRLEQFMGKDGADNYVSQLEEMQKLGAHAVKARMVAKWVAAGLGTGVLGKALHIGTAVLP